MGNINAVPVVSQVKSAVQAIGGDMEGATQTQRDFSKQCPVVSQVRSAVEASFDTEDATRTQMEFIKNMGDVIDATPVLGHIKGAVHYNLGDTEKGDRCMTSASRTTSVVAAFMANGWKGALVEGVRVRQPHQQVARTVIVVLHSLWTVSTVIS